MLFLERSNGMFGFNKKKDKDMETLDEEIRNELEKIRKLSKEDIDRVNGGATGDTREEYSVNPEDINRSIYGALY